MSTHLQRPATAFHLIENIAPYRYAHLARTRFALAASLVLLLTSFARAQPAIHAETLQASYSGGPWLQHSPLGGDIVDVAFSPRDPALLLAAHVDSSSGSSGAMYRSTDAGANWSAVEGFDAVPVYDIEFNEEGHIYAGTLDGIVIADPDMRNWNRPALGIGINDAVLDIAIDAQNPSTLWAGIADAQGLQPVNVMRSDDGGRSWSNRTPPLARPMSCREIAVDPLNSERVIAVFGGDFGAGEIWTSADGGRQWLRRNSGLPNVPLRSVAFAGTRVLVGGGLRLGQQAFGLYASDDFGASWTPLHHASWPTRVVESIAVSPMDDATILIASDGDGVHRTEDGGRSWQLSVAGSQRQAARSVRFRPHSDVDVAVGSIGSGISLSHDRGRHFELASRGVHALNLSAVAIHPFNDRHLAVASVHLNGGAVFTSFDRGQSWTRESAPATRYSSLGFAADGTLYAVSTGPTSVATEGLYRRNADASWTALGPDQGTQYETDIQALRLGQRDAQLMVLAGADRGVSVGYEGTIWISRDRGQHWRKAFESSGAGNVRDIELLESDQGLRLLAAFDDASGAGQGRILSSDDGGDTWQDASRGLPTVISQARLCFAEADMHTVYASVHSLNARAQVYRSDDVGSSWHAVGIEGNAIVDIACEPSDPDTLYVSRQGGAGLGARVERSQNGGKSFEALLQGADAMRRPGQMAVNLSAQGGSLLLLATQRGSYLNTVGKTAD